MIKKRWFFFSLRIIIALLLMTLLLIGNSFEEIYKTFKSPKSPLFILLAFILLVPNIYIQWFRWHFLLRTNRFDITPFESFRSLMGGMVVGFVTPGRIGEMGRSLFLKEGDQLQAVGLVFIDKLYAFITILLGGVWSILFFMSNIFQTKYYLILPLAAVSSLVTFIGLSLALHPQWIRNFLYHISLSLPYRDKLKRVIQSMDRFKTREARLFLGMTLLLYMIYILQFCFLGYAFGKISWGSLVIATTATIFVKTLLPFSIADLGIREWAAKFFFLKFCADKTVAINSALLLFAINILIPTIVGLIFLPGLGSNAKKNSTHK
jgi:uncharacterized protein (TIRG00374 family)